VVVAAAGLARLGRIDEATELLDPQQMLPAPGQGALACECRIDDVGTEHARAAFLNDAGVRAAATAERALLAALEAGCSAPVGALADSEASTLWPVNSTASSPQFHYHGSASALSPRPHPAEPSPKSVSGSTTTPW
jgi:porphobilinogen deaminase